MKRDDGKWKGERGIQSPKQHPLPQRERCPNLHPPISILHIPVVWHLKEVRQ